MEIIKLVNVTKTYEKEEVLSNIHLTVEQGEMIAITGKSGKGKTTLLNIIGLITKKDKGDLLLFDTKNPSIHSKEAMMFRREKIGYLFQNYGLVDDETVKWNLNLALEYKKLSKKEKLEKIDTLLNEFGLSHLKEKMVYQLSGGEQQRIAIIRLILQESDLILADEPTASLDTENEKVILEYLKQLNEKGKTIVVVTHNQDILPYFSRVIRLHELS
ncbi:putative bacteriocin export ABC transporter [Bacillus pseudomycoides]|uniref:putative bacteriocin export ABC transporter n=1 Tax=Bacillus pseudomycoides TaxID=64104 RepID=UPI000BEC7B2A|nr:putative bacteriocin export ABC transporter [Bacillus pseudomycoides]PEE38257.1 bacteriocin ABC transporter ATP-binding protein [Bacillus pseudomycoides]PEI90087.1 bacteriocin ABC transporter ATP-binding protein [Bacillus pseudomycoides]PGA90135.1 bacteriocin ABC transporter ATP-binding protein [Bacillus pseudomycoides]PHF44468.1 bacteriocin ABC transporter ATP-binding protein [Bacillus pseudomycoides]